MDWISNLEREPVSMCRCSWCRADGFGRLLRAWEMASASDRERFCSEVKAADMDWWGA